MRGAALLLAALALTGCATAPADETASSSSPPHVADRLPTPATPSPPPAISLDSAAEPTATGGENVSSPYTREHPAPVGTWIHGRVLSAQLSNWTVEEIAGRPYTNVTIQFEYRPPDERNITFMVTPHNSQQYVYNVDDMPASRTFSFPSRIAGGVSGIELRWIQLGPMTGPSEPVREHVMFVWAPA